MNIYLIAQLAGVSIATVSRVINNYPHVSEEKRRRVQEILKEHRFVPNAAARSLAVNETRTIGIMITDVRHSHYAHTAFTIEQEMNTAGYTVILCNTGESIREQIDYLQVLIEKQVDGIIMVGSIFSNREIERHIRIYLQNTPVVMHNGRIEAENVYSIRTEPELGISLCVDRLVEKGHEKIGFVQDYDTIVGKSKTESFRNMLRSHGLAYKDGWIVRVTSGLDGGREAARKLLGYDSGVSAIIAGDDLTAIGVMKELQEMGKAVPEAVSVIGYNDSLYARICTPMLSSVNNNMEIVGSRLAWTLISILQGKQVDRIQRIKPKLVERESS